MDTFPTERDTEVTVSIYDVQTRRLIGMERLNIASGTYFYQLLAGDCTETRKMVIMK